MAVAGRDAAAAEDGESGHAPSRADAVAPTIAAVAYEAPRNDRAQLRWAFGVGIFLAALIVAVAVVFQPAPGETASPPVDISSAPLPARTPLTDAGAVRDTIVRLRVGDVSPDVVNAYREEILLAGYKGVEILPMPFPVDRGRIEYFAAADRPAAEALARTLAGVADGLMDLRDLQAVAGSGESGRIDAWVAN